MGLWDWAKKAVSTVVSGLDLEHSPIVKSLGSLAGVVAHAIPGVGPVLDVAAPALSAIFSDDSVSPKASHKDDPLDRPPTINLDRTNEEIKTLVTSVKSLESSMHQEINRLGENIDQKFKELMDFHQHQKYIEFLAKVTFQISIFDDQATELQGLTPSSGYNAFNQILNDPIDSLPVRQNKLKEALHEMMAQLQNSSQPSQELLDLYLMGQHWLFVFNKAVIITRGMQAKAYYANSRFTEYLAALFKLNGDIQELRNNAKHAREKLTDVLNAVRVNRLAAIKIEATDKTTVSIVDSWKDWSVGWVSPVKMMEALKKPDLTKAITKPDSQPDFAPQDTTNAIKALQDSPMYLLYTDVATRAMETLLEPTLATIESLAVNLREWSGRVPIMPIPGIQHISTSVPPSDHDEKTHPILVIQYAITYVASTGESRETQWTAPVKIYENSNKVLTLKLEPIKYDDDPKAGFPEIEDAGQRKTPRDRGIRRRIYAQYTRHQADQPTCWLVDTLDEQRDEYPHDIETLPN